MSKRNYTKKDEGYWQKMSQPRSAPIQENSYAGFSEPEDLGDPFTSVASQTAYASTRSASSSESGTRINRAAIKNPVDKFSQIRQLNLPYEYKNGGVDIRDAIELTQKAYAHVSSFKNAIDLMSEFSNTDLYLEGGNQTSRDFFDAWFKRIDIWSLKRHYFLEYFRSSNNFLYRVDADWTVEDMMKLKTIYAAEKIGGSKIPIRYVLLNPYNIACKPLASFSDSVYEQILSPSELSRLKNPISEDDKKFFEGLPQEAKDLINKRSWARDGLRIKIDPTKLHVSFAKKQPYEPFAIPFGFSVLGDINAKLEMKALDMAIMRTVEMAILHVKHGESKTQHGGGINAAVGEALKNIFQNGTVGRTLVTDFTVDAEFIIPDLQKVLGPEKYTIINQDIREGLQNIIVGEEKYGNTQAKINVFLEKLREARQSFLNDFLQPEIKRIAKQLGFRVYPTVKFVDLSLQDNTEVMRIANRLAELGILSPRELMRVFHHGEFPTADQIGLEQEQYVKEREEGKWNPLTPVAITEAAPAPLDPNTVYSIDNRPKPTASPGANKPKAKGINKPAGRPSKASLETLKEVAHAAQKLENMIIQTIGGELNSDQKELAHELMVQIVACESKENWESRAKECLADSKKMLKLQPLSEVLECSAESGLDLFAAAIYVQASV